MFFLVATQFATNVQRKYLTHMFCPSFSQIILKMCPFLCAHFKIHVSILDERKNI
jgi:hypothetical protein